MNGVPVAWDPWFVTHGVEDYFDGELNQLHTLFDFHWDKIMSDIPRDADDAATGWSAPGVSTFFFLRMHLLESAIFVAGSRCRLGE